jgi:cysteine desulfurase
MIYLDYASSTPVDKDVLDTYIKTASEYFANPNSNHPLGLKSKALIDSSSFHIKEMLKKTDSEIIYTSGATESNNLVIKGIAKRYKNFGHHIIISALEHNSIVASVTKLQEEGFDISILPIKKNGIVDLDELKKLIREDTILVSVTSCDSELGIVQPIEEIASLLKNYSHTYFHTDASQAIGKVKINYEDCDLITIAPHKFYGLNGFGCLIKRNNIGLAPIIDGGKSTTIYRAGTPSTADIKALEKALEKALDNLEENTKKVLEYHNYLKDKLSTYKKITFNSNDLSIPYLINFSIIGINANNIVKLLADHEIYLSSKTSCCPVETPSKLVYALTKNKGLANSSIRLSLSHLTTKSELEEFLNIFDKIYKEYESSGKI